MAYMLTTTDNPFDPRTEFDSWLNYDRDLGYNTCGYLSRIANTSSVLSDQENERIIDAAIDHIIATDYRNVYTKVKIADVAE